MKYSDLVNLKKNKIKWLKVIILVVVSSFFYLTPLKLIELMIDVAGKNIIKILIIGALLILTYLLSSIVGAYTDYYIDSFSFETSNKVRNFVFKKILMLDKNQFNDITNGNSFGSLIEDTKIVSESSVKPICLLLKSAVSFIGGLILVTSISPIITIVLIAIGLIATFINKQMSKRYQEQINETREASDKVWNILSEIYEFFLAIKLNNRETFYYNKSQKSNSDLLLKECREDVHNKKMYAVQTIIFMGTIALLYIITTILVCFDKMTMGGLVAIMMYNSILIDPLQELSEMVKQYSKTKVSIERINKYISICEEENNVRKNNTIKKYIEMKNISYENDDKLILNNIDLYIEKGEKVAIVGESGAGKTTLLYLLCGLLEKTNGELIVDGENCESMKDFSSDFSVLLQQSRVYTSNLKDNLCLYTDEWDEDKIREYIQYFELHNILNINDDYMNSPLENISGGEEKRLRLLSVLSKKAGIVCLDELSNSLDNNICNKIMEKIVQECQTVIAIDHRLGLVDKFDKIIFMENGKIEKIGTHEDLMNSCSLYRELYELKSNAIEENY